MQTRDGRWCKCTLWPWLHKAAGRGLARGGLARGWPARSRRGPAGGWHVATFAGGLAGTRAAKPAGDWLSTRAGSGTAGTGAAKPAGDWLVTGTAGLTAGTAATRPALATLQSGSARDCAAAPAASGSGASMPQVPEVSDCGLPPAAGILPAAASCRLPSALSGRSGHAGHRARRLGRASCPPRRPFAGRRPQRNTRDFAPGRERIR